MTTFHYKSTIELSYADNFVFFLNLVDDRPIIARIGNDYRPITDITKEYDRFGYRVYPLLLLGKLT